MEKMIYLDNAATTSVNPKVLEQMLPYFSIEYANPSSVYDFAGKSKKVVEDSREILADIIGASPQEIYFTSGGTESDNWAIKSVCEAYRDKGNHIITSKVEHHAVLHTCEYLERNGFEVTYLDVDQYGIVKLDQLKKAIKETTILISIMAANNEIGTIQPIKEIGQLAKENGVLFHTDAVQAFGKIDIDVNEFNIDLLSASAHKLHGPKGVGILYVRKTVKVTSYMHGGAQERKRRAGTYNVPGIVGMAKASEIAKDKMTRNAEYETELRNYMLKRIVDEIPYIRLNGDAKRRLPNNLNVSFRFIEGESLLIMLDMKKICASSGSACTSGSLDPSHVLLAIGLPHEIAHGSLRFTLSEENTKEEIDYVVDELKGIVKKLRNMSPLYEDFISSQRLGDANV